PIAWWCSLPQKGQIARGYQCASSPAVQRLISSLPWAAASQNGFVSGLTGGGGIERALPVISLSPHDQRGAAVAGRERAAGTVSEGGGAGPPPRFLWRPAPAGGAPPPPLVGSPPVAPRVW